MLTENAVRKVMADIDRLATKAPDNREIQKLFAEARSCLGIIAAGIMSESIMALHRKPKP